MIFLGTYEELKTQQYLFGIHQKPGESTREYARHFSQARCQVQDITEASVINATSAGLCPSELTRKKCRKEPQAVENLFRIIDGFARGEEDTKHRLEIQADYDKVVATQASSQESTSQQGANRPMQPANQTPTPRQGPRPMTWKKFHIEWGKAVMVVEEVQYRRKDFDTSQGGNQEQHPRKKYKKDRYCVHYGKSSHTTEQCSSTVVTLKFGSPVALGVKMHRAKQTEKDHHRVSNNKKGIGE